MSGKRVACEAKGLAIKPINIYQNIFSKFLLYNDVIRHAVFTIS